MLETRDAPVKRSDSDVIRIAGDLDDGMQPTDDRFASGTMVRTGALGPRAGSDRPVRGLEATADGLPGHIRRVPRRHLAERGKRERFATRARRAGKEALA